MNTKIRSLIITFIAAGSITATMAPAISQAQPIDRSGGVVATMRRKVNPCTQLNANYNKAQEALLEAIEKAKDVVYGTSLEINQTQVKEAEGQVNLASIAAFEWGCSVAARKTAPPLGVAVPVTGITSTPSVAITSPVVKKVTSPVTAVG